LLLLQPKNATLDSGSLASAPYQGNWSLTTNASNNEEHNDIITQMWTFEFTPVGTCQLNGDYEFTFDILGWQGVPALTFDLVSQYFCGEIANTSLLGHVAFFSDATLSKLQTSFEANSTAFVLITTQSAFSISDVLVLNFTVNGEVYPEYLMGVQRQVNFGVTFSIDLTDTYFLANSNTLDFEVGVSYSNKKRSDSSSKPSHVTVQTSLEYLVPGVNNTATNPSQSNIPSSSTASSSSSSSISYSSTTGTVPQTTRVNSSSSVPVAAIVVPILFAIIAVVIVVIIVKLKLRKTTQPSKNPPNQSVSV